VRDPFAALVVALTHTGFSMAEPVSRKQWTLLLEPMPPTLNELESRIASSTDPDVRGVLNCVQDVERELERLEEQGVRAVTTYDEAFPDAWREKLGGKAPPVFFAVGETALLKGQSVAILGSRNAPEEALEFADVCARSAAKRGWRVVSGGARGVDFAAVHGACTSGGDAVVVAADALSDVHRKLVRAGCDASHFVVVTANHPDSGFTVGQAMGRNKLVYSLSNVAVIAACEEGSGGTWTGAVEAIRAGWAPVCVWTGPGAPSGNSALAKQGAVPVLQDSQVFEARLEIAGTLFDA
jgi:predicted Rossmann fold nucleotide-binding protein DprA/Smf involved in DNA uptake